MMNNRIELLSPAGDAERLDAALMYGADAVYLGLRSFSMRAAPGNFSADELARAVSKAHAKGVKVYLTCNILPHNSELKEMSGVFEAAASAGVDALIISDMGVFEAAKRLAPDIDIHVSTQTGVVNYAAANVLHSMGASRVVLARELSLEEIAEIRAKTPKELEIECFVHGAMCVSFSGRCLLSNYLTGRDSNRGECAQPCRWKYALTEEKRQGEFFPVFENDEGTYIMNSKDMCLIEHIPELAEAGITSFKIEGRAKSAYYTAVVTNAYRAALDGYFAAPENYKPEKWITDEMFRMSHRDYCTGFFFGSPREDASIFYDGGYRRAWDVAAVAERCEGGRLFAVQRNRFFEGDTLELLAPGMKPVEIIVKNLKNGEGEAVEAAPHPMMKLSFDFDGEVPEGAILRKER